MHRLQIAEELRRVRAHRLGLSRVDAIALAGGQHALPAVALELLMRAGACVLLGQHLGENSIAQSKVGVAEASESEMLQQLGIDLRAGHDDLRPPRPDTGQAAALLVVHLRQLGGQAAQRAAFLPVLAHLFRALGRPVSGFRDDCAGLGQGRGRAGGGDDRHASTSSESACPRGSVRGE